MIRIRSAVAAAAAVALLATLPAGLAQAAGEHRREHGGTRVLTLDPSAPGNNPEGVAWDRGTRMFFVGTVGTGTIYRARLGDSTLRPFITPPAGSSAVGMKVDHGKLFVAGGPTGSISVYDVRTGALTARFETGTGGFLNDLVVTRRGDVYVTDSFRPTLWHLSPAQVAAGSGTPDAIPVSPQIAYTAGQFNLNGIVARRGGRELIVVSTYAQAFYRLTFGRGAPLSPTISPITAPALAGDGLLLDRGRLLVVTGSPAQVTALELEHGDLLATLDGVVTDPALRGPSTIARARERYLVVNADFATNQQPYTVASLARDDDEDD